MKTPDEIHIRSYTKQDEPAIENIVFATGFKGEDLVGRRFIDDKKLLFMISTYYYTKNEPDACFVATESDSDKIVGFICGTVNTALQQKRYAIQIPMQVASRILFSTLWHYPNTLITIVRLIGALGPHMRWRLPNGLGKIMTLSGMATDENDNDISQQLRLSYPAHLHINLVPEYQRRGIGTKLMKRFEEYLLAKNIFGVHLQTTNHNRKALPFYHKLGYTILQDVAIKKHPCINDLRLIVLGKRLVSSQQESGNVLGLKP